MTSQLKPMNPAAGVFVANEVGWANLRDLLLELGCDVRDLTDQSDGTAVSADTAVAWGSTLLESLDLIVVEFIPDRAFEGGVRPALAVPSTVTPVHERTYAAGERRLMEALGRPVEDQPMPSSWTPLTKDRDQLALVTKFAEFCLASGGFVQH